MAALDDFPMAGQRGESMKQKEILLQMEDVSKVYKNGVHGISHISFTVQPGEFVAVIGPSGAGKSTLLRSVNRLQDITSGRILIHGEDISREKGETLRHMRSKIGMIFQNYNLVYRLSVIQNVLHGRLGYMPSWKGMLGLYSQEDKERAVDILNEIHMGDFIRARAADLSGGQKQRVGIARAFMQEPELLLCDEPIASLDPASARLIMDMIHSMAMRRHVACLVNLHQIEAAKRYATRIIGLQKGKLVFDGKPEELTESMISYIYGTDSRLEESEEEAS